MTHRLADLIVFGIIVWSRKDPFHVTLVFSKVTILIV